MTLLQISKFAEMYILLEFVIFCKNLICKTAILKTLYGRGVKVRIKKQKASTKESVFGVEDPLV